MESLLFTVNSCLRRWLDPIPHDLQNDLKAREGRQQQEKQLSINAVQSERRRQAEEKASLQNALDATISRAAAAENKIRALEQTIAQLQSEVTSEKAKSAALESDLSACRAGMAKPLEQVLSLLCCVMLMYCLS